LRLTANQLTKYLKIQTSAAKGQKYPIKYISLRILAMQTTNKGLCASYLIPLAVLTILNPTKT